MARREADVIVMRNGVPARGFVLLLLAACGGGSSSTGPEPALRSSTPGITVLDPIPGDAVVIDVVAVRWVCWITHARDVTSSELQVPVGRPIKLHVWTKETPETGKGIEVALVGTSVKRGVVQNQPVDIGFRIDRPGTYEWKCPTIIPEPHPDRRFAEAEREMRNPIKRLIAMPAADYDAFIAANDVETMDPVELGKQLYDKKGCSACHTIDGTPRVGPTWKGIWGTQVTSGDGKTRTVDEQFIEESVRTPGAFVLKSFPPTMPSYEGQLKPAEIRGLIAFIKSLTP